MRNSRLGVVGAMFVLLALLFGACGDSGDDTDTDTGTGAETSEEAGGEDEGTCASFSGDEALTVGGTNFSEQEIVAEIYAQCLEAAGFDVDTKLKIGSREIVLPALEKGDIDLYPEYIGSYTAFLDKNATVPTDVAAAVTQLTTLAGAKSIVLGAAAPAEDKNGFVVKAATASN
jgi:osmoprotectant transport system substrate-binding protein